MAAVLEDGEQLLDYLRHDRAFAHLPENDGPRVILLDLNMPRMSGLEFLKAARKDGSANGIPIVVLTTSRQDQDVVEGFNYNVAGYMIKPVDYAKFVEVMQAIDRYWSLSELPA